MAPIRIVVKDRALLAAGKPRPFVKPVQPVKQAYAVQPPRSKRGDLAMLCQAVDIALEYFNSDDSVPLSTLTAKARIWADRYFKGYRYAAKRPTSLLRTFPNLFNLEVEAPLRLVPKVMPSPSASEPDGASPRELRRAERRSMNSEAFPEFAEPTLASDAELDQIVDLRTRQRGADSAAKPRMRVDAAMLRGSGLMSVLPEFLGQLARANLETETMLATNPAAVRFELDEDEAAEQPHIEMNLFAGLVEPQRRRRQRGVVLPGEPAFKLPTDSESESSESESSVSAVQRSPSQDNASDEDSGDDTDASTSTTASLHANLKKRKSAALEDADDAEAASPPNKIRIQYYYPPLKLRHYDMKRRKLVSRANPAAVPDDPFDKCRETPTAPAAPSTPSRDRPAHTDSSSTSSPSPSSAPSPTSSSSSSSSGGSSPVPITKIRVPSRSPDGSRSASPDRIIVLRHPVLSPPSAERRSPSSSSESSSSSSEEPGSPGASSSASSSSSSSSSSRRPRIKLLQKNRPGSAGKRLIEEVE
ncbi:uncharacterized protein THITE_2107028 [Thermothielavioides terrestris NRRL 8126]|uniref:Uncharacterized protein n=1 Tax=Thermothielavioides terrestris (strain ATCC 38088 / NRRL 8126) TaxID=578455 RepID=G2QSF2_THETT|nr:uncharacterized protein THITE_2107028 [Thermothielavioides terrestris NRRL 8126]AEO62633.1 hypothetical protein THITE_2107028 [Thermothielavioides terrestris NRRL 8126]